MTDEKNEQQGNLPVDDSSSEVVDFSSLIEERSFIGALTVESIFEGLGKQFEDYIDMEDTTNYVDVFYQQLYLSLDRVKEDDSEEHPNEIKEVLDRIYQRFVDLMQERFSTRLTITITELESGSMPMADLEFVIRRLYEFFILGAKNNFKIVISNDIIKRIDNLGTLHDDEYFSRLQGMMNDYSPLITTLTATEFLQYRGDKELYDLYENGVVAGNFLRRYSPKLYQNEEFAAELVNYITTISQFQQEIEKSSDEDDGVSTFFVSNSASEEDAATIRADNQGKTELSEYDYPDQYYGSSEIGEEGEEDDGNAAEPT